MATIGNKNIILYFVRHGECIGNVNRCIPPNDEDILTENGKEQAAKLGKHLDNVLFTKVYSSDYSRALETANIIIKNSKHQILDCIQKDYRLREQHYGIHEGKTYREALGDIIKSKIPVQEYEVPGGETNQEMIQRIDKFLQDILTDTEKTQQQQNPTDQILLIVSHSFCLLRLMNFLYKNEKYEIINWKNECRMIMGNTSYTKIQINRIEDDNSTTTSTNTSSAKHKKWRVEFLEIQYKEHLGEDAVKEMNQRNEVLKKFINETENGHVLSGCTQT